MLDTLLPPAENASFLGSETTEAVFLSALTWSLGGGLLEDGRIVFDGFLKRILSLPQNPAQGSVVGPDRNFVILHCMNWLRNICYVQERRSVWQKKPFPRSRVRPRAVVCFYAVASLGVSSSFFWIVKLRILLRILSSESIHFRQCLYFPYIFVVSGSS